MIEREIQAPHGNSRIIIGDSIKNLQVLLTHPNNVVITDETVKSYYGAFFSDFPTIEIGQGEKIKNLDTVKRIYEKFLDLEIDRSTFIIGIGGGLCVISPDLLPLHICGD